MPYMTLTYANGLGAYGTGNRRNLTGVDTTDKEFIPEAHVPLESETHGGEDVPIYAHGPMSHLFHGVHEQNYVAHVMGYASCVGPNMNHCNTAPTNAASHYSLSLVDFMLMYILVKAVQ